MRRGVFLDLNGTLTEPVKPERLDQFVLLPDVVASVARLTAAGFVCPVVTVQSRIEKGLFTHEEFHAWFATFAADLARGGALVVGPYVCPHRFARPCSCKKPSTLLYECAAREHEIDPATSFVIGDSPDDIRAARRLGAKGCLVRTGWAVDPRVVERAVADGAAVFSSLKPAVDWLVGGAPPPLRVALNEK